MAIVLKDRVKQTATAPGTGTITLGATAAGFQAFSAIGDGNPKANRQKRTEKRLRIGCLHDAIERGD